MDVIINTYGTAVSRDAEGFVIENAEGCQRIPAEGLKSIQICRGAQISSDAVMLAIAKEIEVLFVGKGGDVFGRVWSPNYGSISTIRKGQLNFSLSRQALIWIKEVLRKKIENQQALMLMMETSGGAVRSKVDSSIHRLEEYRRKIGEVDGESVGDVASTLRGWEGLASKIYFETLNLFLPEEYRFANRSQHPALDVVNALLNYGYGMLYGKIEGALIKTGIDPYIGVLHRDEYNRPVLVYDVIEIYRVWVDYVVYSLVMQRAITEECYSFQPDGSCWLEALGRRILIQSVNDYLSEVIEQNDLQRSRGYQMFLYAQNLAQQFKNME